MVSKINGQLIMCIYIKCESVLTYGIMHWGATYPTLLYPLRVAKKWHSEPYTKSKNVMVRQAVKKYTDGDSG